MSGIRESFVQKFGEEEALRFSAAAEKHANGVNSDRKGSDPFRWAITIVIGYQCAAIDSYREGHGITAPWPEVQKWIKRSAKLAEHDGDMDYLALMAGKYDEYMPKRLKAVKQ